MNSRVVGAISIFFLAAAILTVQGAAPKTVTVVRDVSLSKAGQSLEVQIKATEQAKFNCFELKNPHRLVIDFPGIQNGIAFRQKEVDAAGVARIRTSLFANGESRATRIVFDLAESKVPYRVTDEGGGLVRVVFGQSTGNASAEPARASAQKAPAESPAKLSPVLQAMTVPVEATPAAGAPAAGAPPVTATVAATQEVVKPITVVQDLLVKPAEPPQELSKPTTPPADDPVKAAPKTDPASAAPAGSAPAPPAQTQPSQQVRFAPAVTVSPIKAPAKTAQYTGELTSWDLKDVDIKDFFRLLHEVSGLNVVLDPNVGGSLTLSLENVPWDQALDIVLQNHQLGGELQGNVLRIATNSTLQSEESGRKAVRDAEEKSIELLTKMYVLNYTKAAATLTTVRPILTPRGTVIQDTRKNALLITDVPTQFGKIDQTIQFLDTPMPQVEIEARLLSANKSFSRDLGNQLGFLFGNQHGNILTGGSGASSPINQTPPPRVTVSGGGTGVPLAVNLPAAATSGLAFLLQPGSNILLDEIITAAEAVGTAKLISRPTVMTQNNQAATISQGTQIPVQTNVNNTISTQFLSFALRLTVTPQITDVGTILLTADIENSQPDFARAVNGVPSVATQQATTQVLVPDGGTAVVGGILVDQDSVNIRQVPGLGSLPLVGYLFKEESKVKSTSELFFFITPRIKPRDTLQVTPPGSGSPVCPPGATPPACQN
jgi:type IV pilus assembly protein PilQ